MERPSPVLILGAGLAGLNCARVLNAAGIACEILESSDRVGGRCGSDYADGFTLDRGFQILLDSYPELPSAVDMASLELRPFTSGAMIWLGNGFTKVLDPTRRPLSIVKTLRSPVGTLLDKWRALRLVATATRSKRTGYPTNLPAIQRLRLAGLSERMISQFLRPFFAGVFLENELSTSSRQFDFIYPLFATGRATLPAKGMQALPDTMAAALSKTTIRLRTPAYAIEHDCVRTAGDARPYRALVVATPPDVAARLLGTDIPRGEFWTSNTTAYFAADRPPTAEPLLVLNGSGDGALNNVAVLTNVAPTYAPPGKTLIACNFVGRLDADDARSRALAEARQWFGEAVDRWQHVHTCVIEHALPDKRVEAYETIEVSPRVRPGVYLAGDYCDFASINGALAAGRRAAEAVIGDFNGRGRSLA